MKKQNQIKNIFKSSDITQTQVAVEKQSTLFDKITLKLFNLYKKMLPPENLEEANSRIDALKSDNSLYKMFFESMTEAVGVISPLGNILFTNHRIPAILCYSEKEIIGNNIFELLDKNNQVIIIKQLIKQKQKNDWSSYQLSWTAKDGRQIPTIVSPKPIYNDKNQFIGSFAMITEVTHLKAVEQQLMQSIEEKEVLFKELAHRTKNNMQVINSLLGLQASGISDPKVQEIFKETQNRIMSMAKAHQMLYQASDLTRIDFKSYLQDLSSGLIRSYKFEPDKVRLDFQVETVNVSLETAVTCGLVVNELITNSLKYAFPENCHGVIRIRLFTEGDQFIHLYIGDDGVGFSDNFDFNHATSLGIRLITNLVQRQLKGTLEVGIQGSPEFRIRFKNVPPRHLQLSKKFAHSATKMQ
jgi:PAS domain S-box-containing protein